MTLFQFSMFAPDLHVVLIHQIFRMVHHDVIDALGFIGLAMGEVVEILQSNWMYAKFRKTQNIRVHIMYI